MSYRAVPWTEKYPDDSEKPTDASFVWDGDGREICTVYIDDSMPMAERIAAALNAWNESKSWGWIPVSEGMPPPVPRSSRSWAFEDDRQFLARNAVGYCACVTALYRDMDGRLGGEDATPEATRDVISEVTHWMPLDAPQPHKPGHSEDRGRPIPPHASGPATYYPPQDVAHKIGCPARDVRNAICMCGLESPPSERTNGDA